MAKIMELGNEKVSIQDVDEDLIPIIVGGLQKHLETHKSPESAIRYKECDDRVRELIKVLDDWYFSGF